MKRTRILNPKELKRTTFREVEEAFFKHCRLKNLWPHSIEYDREDLLFFHTQDGFAQRIPDTIRKCGRAI